MELIKKIRSRLFRDAKYLYRDISLSTGFSKSFYESARGSCIIIYHGICQQDHTRFNPIFLKQKTFESHLKFYQKYFNVISLDDYYMQRFSRHKFNVSLTFDDGFANNYKYVLPLLEQYKLPATFFITAIRASGYDILWNDFLNIVGKYGPPTMVYNNEHYYKDKLNKYISTKSGISLTGELRCCGFEEKAEMMKILYPLVPFKANKDDEDYWLQMTEQQVKQLSASPFANIGAHGHYHNDLARISIDDAKAELAYSKRYLEHLIEKPVNSFAFPYDTYTPEVIKAAKQYGYSQLLAMDFHYAGDHKDAAMRERFTVNPFLTTTNQMYATVKRRYDQ